MSATPEALLQYTNLPEPLSRKRGNNRKLAPIVVFLHCRQKAFPLWGKHLSAVESTAVCGAWRGV